MNNHALQNKIEEKSEEIKMQGTPPCKQTPTTAPTVYVHQPDLSGVQWAQKQWVKEYNHDSDVIGLAQTPLITAHTLH